MRAKLRAHLRCVGCPPVDRVFMRPIGEWAWASSVPWLLTRDPGSVTINVVYAWVVRSTGWSTDLALSFCIIFLFSSDLIWWIVGGKKKSGGRDGADDRLGGDIKYQLPHTTICYIKYGM